MEKHTESLRAYELGSDLGQKQRKLQSFYFFILRICDAVYTEPIGIGAVTPKNCSPSSFFLNRYQECVHNHETKRPFFEGPKLRRWGRTSSKRFIHKISFKKSPSSRLIRGHEGVLTMIYKRASSTHDSMHRHLSSPSLTDVRCSH